MPEGRLQSQLPLYNLSQVQGAGLLLNEGNALITGWGLIIMGLITIPLAAFFIYIQNKEWKPMFWWNHSEIGYYGDTKTNEKNLAEYRFILGFSTVVSLLFAIVLPILGVLRLLGIV